ncbi:hypothetical protein HDV03_000093 [Kappamyces sp. JEL0829]|nr:hypothetical protein HDV03_000093 [Kappamyces sp. JEL0829]
MKETSVKIKIFGCRNLTAKDKNGTSDPYVQVRLGRQKQTTRVVPKNLNPSWMQEFTFQIPSSQFSSAMQIAVWDKNLIKSVFLGYIEFPVADLLQMDYEEGENDALWYPLSSRSPKETISGDILLKIGLVSPMESSLRAITRSLKDLRVSRNASLISTDDPSDLIFFNHTVTVANPEDGEPELSSGTVGSGDISLILPSVKPDVVSALDSDLAGVMLIDVVGARNLPYEKSALKNSFNCDPFVCVSFGTKTFRTKVVHHNLNPTWNESIYLHLKKSDLKSEWPLRFRIYDFERFTKNNAIAEIDCKIENLIDSCEKPIRNQNKPTLYPHSEMKVDLKIKNQRATVKESSSLPYIIIHCSFIPYPEIRRNFWLALLNQYESSPAGSVEKKIDKVSLVTMLDSIECNFSDETINNMFASVKKATTEELTFAEAVEALELKIKPSLDKQLSPSTTTSTAGPQKQLGLEDERIILIKVCPICKKEFSQRGDFDVVSHLALCSHGQIDKLDQLAMGGFLTQEAASSKWLTKVFSYVTFGGLAIGKNNGQIVYQDRQTGQLQKEKIPAYIRIGIRLLYQVAGSKSTVESKSIKRLLKSMTIKQGIKFDSPASVKHIAQFAAYHNLDLDEVLDPIESFKSFNEFFFRKLKPGARVLASEDPAVLVCPADARSNCFATIADAQSFWIKGSKFTLATLLGSEELASQFHGGSLAIFRLAPQDYHRFHFPVDGVLESSKTIEGAYYTVNPMAVRTTVDVYTENARNISIIQSEHHGKVAYISVGAMLVGSIVLTSQVGGRYKRMDEHGYFKFGGSTIVLLFERNRVTFDADLVANSTTSLETLVRMGNSLGVAKV